MAEYEYVIEGCYGGYGYEEVSAYPYTPEGRREALNDLQAYRENEPEYHHRLKSKKVQSNG